MLPPRPTAVGPRDADLLGRVIPARELNLGDDVRPLRPKLLHHRHGTRDARGLDDLVGIEDQFLRVTAFLEGNVPLLQRFDILVLDLPLVGQEDLMTFHFCEDGCAHSAFSAAQNHDSRHIYLSFFYSYLIFNRASVETARRIWTIQNRRVTFTSWNPCPLFGLENRLLSPSGIIST